MNGTGFIGCQGCRQARCHQAGQCMGWPTTDNAERMAALEERLAQAEARIARLESTRTVYGPVPGTQTPTIPAGWTYNGLPGTCATCGIKWEGRAIGYVCPRGDCPSQITCSADARQ